jgi:hypothetical protein
MKASLLETALQPDLSLGHLVFELRHPDRWASFSPQMLGLPEPMRLQMQMASGLLATKLWPWSRNRQANSA